MYRIRIAWVGLAMVGVIVLPLLAEEKLSEHTRKLGADGKSPPATLADVAWMAGRWSGTAFGGDVEEIWSGPAGGSLMGMFRMVKDGKPAFYEMMVISEEGGSLILRLKHFNADMTGWEEKRKTIDFPLVSKTADALHFEGLTVLRNGVDAATHYVAIRQKDGSVKEEAIRYKRQPMASS